jgi:hypothetical protein
MVVIMLYSSASGWKKLLNSKNTENTQTRYVDMLNGTIWQFKKGKYGRRNNHVHMNLYFPWAWNWKDYLLQME